jgi:Cupin-like domain
VKVEERPPGGAFGRGVKKSMHLSAFLLALRTGNDRLYLSTQPSTVDFDGHPELLSEPLASIHQHAASGGGRRAVAQLPLRPQCMGSLVPQAVNMWLGRADAARGTSSGLHHDYHDNLYVLLSGRKRFRLFAPEHAHHMATHGRVKCVHDSGRCVLFVAALQSAWHFWCCQSRGKEGQIWHRLSRSSIKLVCNAGSCTAVRHLRTPMVQIRQMWLSGT